MSNNKLPQGYAVRKVVCRRLHFCNRTPWYALSYAGQQEGTFSSRREATDCAWLIEKEAGR